MFENGLQKLDVRSRAGEAEFGQCTNCFGRELGEPTGARMHDDLGKQGIEPGIGAVTGVAVAVDAHPGARRGVIRGQNPARRAHAAV